MGTIELDTVKKDETRRPENENVGVEEGWEGEGEVVAAMDHQQYGVKSCQSVGLQACNTPKVALVWICWFCMVQGFAVNGVNNVNTTTLERRFNLPSSTVGMISSAYDFAAGILVLPITYLGARSHHPRMLAIAALFMSIGSFLMSLPHFTSGPYDTAGSATAGQCDSYGNATDVLCGQESSSTSGLSNYLYVFLLAQFLHGVGGTIIYTIGIIYLDDNVLTDSMPIYQGVMYSSSALGPAIGYVVGGRLLNVYVDFDTTDTTKLSLTPEDPRWVGAWWVAFVVASGLFLTVFLLFLPYPRQTPNAAVVRKFRVSMAHDDGSEEKMAAIDFGQSVRDLPAVMGILLKNPVNMLVTFGAVTEGLLVSGFMTFVPKLIQNQFGLNAGVSAMLGGGIAVPAATGGQFFGGFISRCLHLRVRGMLRLCTGLCLAVAVLSFVTLSDCGSATMSGVTVAYRNSTLRLIDVSLMSQCNEHCHCTTRSYEPICGMDGVQYFSPCHAGCDVAFKENNKKVFSNCSCIAQANSSMVAASSGKCSSGCDLVWVFLPLFFLVTFFTFSATVPGTVVSLRCIPENTKPFALGMKWMFVRFLGTVPGPILFGVVFDNTCTVWQRKCSQKGSCWIYNNAKLRMNLLITTLCIKLVSASFFGMAAFCYRAPSDDKLVNTKSGGVHEVILSTKTDNQAFMESEETGL